MDFNSLIDEKNWQGSDKITAQFLGFFSSCGVPLGEIRKDDSVDINKIGLPTENDLAHLTQEGKEMILKTVQEIKKGNY